MLVPSVRLEGYILLVLGPLICWSRWPLLRSICGLPVNAFVILNISAQFAAAICWAALLGPADVVWHDLTTALAHFDGRVAAVITGGFLLAHGDHIGSVAMQRLPASHAYMLYAGFTMGMGTLLNEIIEPVKAPGRLVGGVALVFLGIASLGLRVVDPEAEADRGKLAEDLDAGLLSADESGALPDAGLQLQRVAAAPSGTDSEESRRRTQAVGLCILAGLCGMGWSPLSTFAAQGIAKGNSSSSTAHPHGWQPDSHDSSVALANPFAFILLFVGGELLGVPSVVALGSWLEDVSPQAAFRFASPRRLAAGLATGLAVNLGYLGYFLAVSLGPDVLPSTTAFAFSACNPVVSLLAHEGWAWWSSRGTPQEATCRCGRHRVLTLASLAFYCAAIALLSV